MNENLAAIKKFYEEAFQFFDKTRKMPEIDVVFYPYVGINHTIRVRDGRVYVRLAEICQTMPLGVERALAYILTAKLLRKKVPAQANQVYSEYIKRPEMRDLALANKRAKGKKIISSAQGAVYDLDEIFDRLNHVYFKNTLAKPVLTWSARKTFRILGHHDAAHETIVVSQSLDDRKIPPYVVEFIVFHEMLHIFHPTEYRNGRRYNHTAQFRRSEKKFKHYAEAENWIERNARNLKKEVKKVVKRK